MNSTFIKASSPLCRRRKRNFAQRAQRSRPLSSEGKRDAPKGRLTVKQIHHISPRRFNAVLNPSPTEEVASDRMALVAPVKDQLDPSRLVMAL